MKSIRDTLEIIRDITNALPVKLSIALTGGYAVILHGVERTTLDLDFCLYSDLLASTGSKAFFELLKKNPGKIWRGTQGGQQDSCGSFQA